LHTFYESVHEAIQYDDAGHGSAQHDRFLESVDDATLRIGEKVTGLLKNLNLKAEWPAVANVDEDYTVKLLQAQQAKEQVRQKAMGVFCERDRLDQAVAGKNLRLGTFSSTSAATVRFIFDRHQTTSTYSWSAKKKKTGLHHRSCNVQWLMQRTSKVI
jgi:hypothetical protein